MKVETLRRALAPLLNRIAMLAARAVVSLVDDGLKLQGLQLKVMAGETRTAERFQDYGFTSHPHPGAEAIALSLGGNRDHTIAIRVDDRRYRLQGLAEGEVAVYDDLGTTVILRRGGKLEIRAVDLDFVATGDVLIQGTNVTINGTTRVDVDGPVVDLQDKGNYEDHAHTGVQPGGGTSGPVA